MSLKVVEYWFMSYRWRDRSNALGWMVESEVFPMDPLEFIVECQATKVEDYQIIYAYKPADQELAAKVSNNGFFDFGGKRR